MSALLPGTPRTDGLRKPAQHAFALVIHCITQQVPAARARA